jgi:hypothetical protein
MSLTVAEQQKNADIAMDFFVRANWTPVQAAAIVGNLLAESNMDPRATNPAEDAWGLAQWRLDRSNLFKDVYGLPIQESTLDQQLAFVQWELLETHKTAYRMLKQTTDIAFATQIVDDYYERSAGLHLTRRIDYAQIQYNRYCDRINNRLDEEIEQSMDASDPPSVVQPGDTGEPVPSSTEPTDPKKGMWASIIEAIVTLFKSLFKR